MTVLKTVGLEHLVQFGDGMSDMHPSVGWAGALSVSQLPVCRSHSRQYTPIIGELYGSKQFA
jgi:hypothetical protein